MRESLRRLLSEHCTEKHVRHMMESSAANDLSLWNHLVAIGIPGLLIEPTFGGIGGGPVEIEDLMEEAGAHLMSAPLLSSGVMAAQLLSFGSDELAKARLLPEIASGARIAAVALSGGRCTDEPNETMVTAESIQGKWTLNGFASYVIDAQNADTLLVVAKTDSGLCTFEVPAGAAGVKISPEKTFDRTLRLSRIAFEGVPAIAITGTDECAVRKMLNVAHVALAGEQVGAARHVFDTTISYIKERIQFGRPVGSFQALKHMAADLLLELESATTVARQAAQAIESGSADGECLVHLAAFTCADAFEQIAATSIQMHGGIAFTWDHPAHLYLRRARADAYLLGSPVTHRERYLAGIERIVECYR